MFVEVFSKMMMVKIIFTVIACGLDFIARRSN